MTRVVRWLFRLMAAGILLGVWSLLPVVMPGPSRLLALVHLACLVVAVDFAGLLLLGSILPASRLQQPSGAQTRRTPTAEGLRRAAQLYEKAQGERHD